MAKDIHIDELEGGDRLTVVVNRRSGKNIIIDTKHSHINIGEVDDACIGEEVSIQILDVGGYAIARCLDEQYTSEQYSPEDMLPVKRESIPPDKSTDWDEWKKDAMSDLPDRM